MTAGVVDDTEAVESEREQGLDRDRVRIAVDVGLIHAVLEHQQQVVSDLVAGREGDGAAIVGGVAGGGLEAESGGSDGSARGCRGVGAVRVRGVGGWGRVV